MAKLTKNIGASNLLHKMEGITVALFTPLDATGNLDVKGLERLVKRVLDGGACGLFPLGWAGEGPLHTDRLRGQVMREVCRLANGKVPVMVGVSEQSLPRSLELTAMARDAGADLVLSTPPFSYPLPQRLVYEYFAELAATCGLPLVLYQNDEVGVRIEHDTLARLSGVPNIVGVKAFVNFLDLQRSFHRCHQPGRFAVMSGDEYLYAAALLLGIRHFTMGGPGNLCPAWCVSIYRSALKSDWEAVRKKQKRLTDFCDALYLGTDSAYAAVKYALELLGICSAKITPPHRPLPSDQQKQVAKALATFADVMQG